MLKVSIDNGGDYLEYLRPYVLYVLKESPPELINDTSVAIKIREVFGLEIPQRTVQIVLRRLARSDFLVKEKGIYTTKHLPELDNLIQEKVDAMRHITVITEGLISFSNEHTRKKINEDEATSCLTKFLSQFSIPCLKSYLRGTTLPKIEAGADWKIKLVSQYVADISKKTSEFDSFLRLVKGHMLANALLCPDLESIADNFKELTFYFDTRLLIQLLGLEGKEEESAINELVSFITILKGTVSYFSHTYDELTNSILTSAEFIDSPKGRGSIVDEARKAGVSKSDLIILSQKAESILDEKGIKLTYTPDYDIKKRTLEISEGEFEKVLEEHVSYSNDKARINDIKSVRAIYILRQGIKPLKLEKSKAILVTSNSGYSKAAYSYGENHEVSGAVSTVITDFSLANIAWLKSPWKAPNLPEKELLAAVYAANRPSQDFWTKVLSEADKLEKVGRITSREHQLLRSSDYAKNELMRLTLGDDKELNAESITDTLDRVTKEIEKEKNEELRAESISHEATKTSLSSLESTLNDLKERICSSSQRKANIEARVISITIWMIQTAIAVWGVCSLYLHQNKFASISALVIAIGSGAVRMAGALWDIKPLTVTAKYKVSREQNLIAKAYKNLGLEKK
jgi:hypothetical protein